MKKKLSKGLHTLNLTIFGILIVYLLFLNITFSKDKVNDFLGLTESPSNVLNIDGTMSRNNNNLNPFLVTKYTKCILFKYKVFKF